MRDLKLTALATLVVLALSACGGTPSQSEPGPLSGNLKDTLVTSTDFDVQLEPMSPDESILSMASYSVSNLFPENCESGKNELFNAVDTAIVGFFVPVNFKDSDRNNDFTVVQEAFRFSSVDEADSFIAVVQKSATDSNYCATEYSTYSELISPPTKLTPGEFGLTGLSWYEEVAYDGSSWACGDAQAIYRTSRWVQKSNTDIFITTAEGVECNAGNGTEEYVETVRLGELAAKSLAN
jgi:hypothetical protein